MNLFRTQPVTVQPHVDAGEHAHGSIEGEVTLKRVLTARHLVMLGIGAVIGAGIFVLTGNAAANHAGPAVVLSFVMAGIACGFAGLCYAEFAAMLPVSGSLILCLCDVGELVAWFHRLNLVLELTVRRGPLSRSAGPGTLPAFRIDWQRARYVARAACGADERTTQHRRRKAVLTGALINLPAVAIVIAVAPLCYRGISQSANANAIVVAIRSA